MLTPTNTAQPLNRIYVEITNRCNLDCRICIRNTWNDSPGTMPLRTYQKLIKDIQSLDPIPEIFFGGYGEPLSHPDIIEMIQSTNRVCAKTALVTNGTLLSTEMSEALITAGLDRLWVSLDGAHSESYQDVQLGEYLPQIILNLEKFQDIKTTNQATHSNQGTEWGIAFVMMKKNAADFLEIIELGKQLGTNSFFVTFMEAYSEDRAREALYQPALSRNPSENVPIQSEFWPPGLTQNKTLAEIAQKFLVDGKEISIEGSLSNMNPTVCPFVDRGATVVRWDGEVSPCLPLLYNHVSILGSWKRQIYSFSVGNIDSNSMLDLWLDPEYKKLRERLQDKRFSPCVDCRDCWLSDDNLFDCMGYEHPTCGGCLWSQGMIQCP